MTAVRDGGDAPPTRRGRVTRDRIVEAAAELMYRGGVAGTRIDDVRAAAGVSSSQLYHYFADKSELVRAVVARQADAVLAGQQPVLSRLDSLEALRAWRDLLVETAGLPGAAGCPLGSLASELSHTDEGARVALAAGFARWDGAIAAGLRAMRERGELGPDTDVDRLALALLAAVEGGLLLGQARRDTAALAAALDTALDHIGALARATH